MQDGDAKVCFVIAPIGEPGSSTRERSDLVLEHIIQPALDPYGYKALRADDIDRPGIITTQVIQHVLDAPLVIADLTERNPNVFYELAIRHITRKPFIQITQEGEGIPFDVAATRLIVVDHSHLGRAAEAREKIKAQIESLEADPDDLETPISTSLDLQRLKQSDAPQDRLLMDSVSTVVRSELSNFAELVNIRGGLNRNEVQSVVEEMVSPTRPSRSRPAVHYTNELRDLTRSVGGKYGFLLTLSLFKDSAPWVYEMGMEAYRRIEEREFRKAIEVFERLTPLIGLSMGILPGYLVSAMDDLQIFFREAADGSFRSNTTGPA